MHPIYKLFGAIEKRCVGDDIASEYLVFLVKREDEKKR
jgi:hypothetical protein